jgi:hypothetical protein
MAHPQTGESRLFVHVRTLAAVVVVGLACIYLFARFRGSTDDARVPVKPEAPIRRPSVDETPASAPVVGRREFAENPVIGVEASQGAVIEGRVVDQFDASLEKGEVRLVGRGDPSDGDDESPLVARIAEGSFRLERVAPGDYDVVIVPSSLPSGVEPPFDQRTRASREYQAQVGPGYFATAVLVAASTERHEVRLQVWRPTRVVGRVLSSEAQPVGGAVVTLQSVAPGLRRLSFDAKTGLDGAYEHLAVLPGPYRVSVYAGETAEEFRRLARPVPLDFEVRRDATETAVPTLYLGGDVDVVGRVLNVEGEPYADGLVMCHANAPVVGAAPPHDWLSESQRARTDAEGRFRLVGMPRARFKLVIEPEGYLPGRLPGENRLVDHGPQRDLDLSAAARVVDVGTMTVDVSRPFRVGGAVNGDAVAAKDWSRYVVVVEPVPGFVYRRPARGRPEPSIQRVPLDANGRFEWLCETPYPEVDIRLSRVDQSRSTVLQRVVPHPGGRVALSFTPP